MKNYLYIIPSTPSYLEHCAALCLKIWKCHFYIIFLLQYTDTEISGQFHSWKNSTTHKFLSREIFL